jgi:hypothetical protein
LDKHPDWFVYSNNELKKITGGRERLAERLREGDLFPRSSLEFLGKWTPEFWSGLKSSGVICSDSRNRNCWHVNAKGRTAVNVVFKDRVLPFHCTVSKSKIEGRILLSGLWVAQMAVGDPSGIGVLAGLLAGSRRVEYKNRSWIGVCRREANAALLKSYGIPYSEMNSGGFRRCYLVSPFWGKLLAHEMPDGFREWYEGWDGRIGGCPLLPWVFLSLAWGCKSGWKIPKGVLPCLIRRDSLFLTGVKFKAIRELGIRELGMLRVDVRLRVAWLERMRVLGIKAADFREGQAPVGL